MKFLTEPVPPRGVALDVAPGIRRVVADNPGPMTYHGTNTYLLDWADGVAVLDPGPDDAAHIRDVLDLAAKPIRAIVLTHGHHDHWGALAALREATRALLYAWHESDHAPDHPLTDGAAVGPWRALHTPGHAPDHLCFVGPDGIVVSGDHVMGWSSTVVGGADGDMGAYFTSLERLIDIPAQLYLPGHGPPIPEPVAYAESLLAHRRAREAEIFRALTTTPMSVESLVSRLYPGLAPALHPAAARNVLAHLHKLAADARAKSQESGWVRLD